MRLSLARNNTLPRLSRGRVFCEHVMTAKAMDSKATDLAFGIVASIIAGVALAILKRLSVEPNVATSLILIPVSSICLIFRKETLRITRTTVLFGFSGILLGAAYYLIFYFYRNVKVLVEGFDGSFYFVIFFLNMAIVIPMFEEIVVRRLMFMGLTKYVNALLAAFIISLLFGIAHQGSMVWAFVFSLCMCALTYRGIGSIDRAIIHGAFNATLIFFILPRF